MTAKPLQIEGLVVDPDDVAERYDGARQRLENELRSTKHDLEDMIAERDRLARTIKNLQTTLNPMHRALSALFGEIDLAVGEDVAPASNGHAPSSATDPRWQSYKDRFPGVPAKIIDALLTHGEMKVSHLIKFVGAAHGTVYNAGDKLQGAGAINRNGGVWSLKR